MGSLVSEAPLTPAEYVSLLAGILSVEQKNILSPKPKEIMVVNMFSILPLLLTHIFILFKFWHFRFVIKVWDREGGRNQLPVSIGGRNKQKLLCKIFPT